MIFCKRQEKFESPTLKLVGEAMIKKEERQEEEEKHNPAPTQTPPPGPGPHPPPPSYTSLHSILLQSTTNSSSSTSTASPDACRQLGDVRRLSDVGNYRSFLGCPSSQVPNCPSAQVPKCPSSQVPKCSSAHVPSSNSREIHNARLHNLISVSLSHTNIFSVILMCFCCVLYSKKCNEN